MSLFSNNKNRRKTFWVLLFIFLISASAFFVDYPLIWNKMADTTGLPQLPVIPFKLGLDLQGGTHLVYEADFSNIGIKDRNDSMEGVREVIERRINLFGVAEPVVQVNKVGTHYRLIVELAGIKDVGQAIKMIGQTPALDFREEKPEEETEEILERQKQPLEKLQQGLQLTAEEEEILSEDPYFQPTDLTGRFLEGAELGFDQQTFQSRVNLKFNDEGADIFEELTEKNVGKKLAIYLDGVPISAPVVQSAIAGGNAEITGNFTIDEAKELVRRLNAGALPVPIHLINQQTIGASLGHSSLTKSLQAGILGFIAVLIFMLFSYRLPGLLADLALLVYALLIMAMFKLIPVTLTLAGIAGFILSIGMAVDANVLIFERFKEEFKTGKSLGGSIDEGFHWAWPAIRDGNFSTIITCIILFVFATGAVKGFAVTLGLGIMISMFSAIIVTRNLMKLFVNTKLEKWRKLWG